LYLRHDKVDFGLLLLLCSVCQPEATCSVCIMDRSKIISWNSAYDQPYRYCRLLMIFYRRINGYHCYLCPLIMINDATVSALQGYEVWLARGSSDSTRIVAATGKQRERR